ncbi:MAG: acyltransferase [Chloroflexi bacterium HGW-Chloroflexi-2]|jgi:acetyltransferase-like isoleucine patch superfamily enzyme|nr:MAG: acyltransferase [Chloroflexi bacterium HGW-Chloroflexi-2]
MKKIFRLLRYDWPLHFVLLFTNWLPDNVVFLRLRGWLASHFLGACGKDLRIGRNVTFYNPSRVYFGKNIYIAYGCWFNADSEIKLENEVQVGPYCVIVSSDHRISGYSFRYSEPSRLPIHIGVGSWLGSHVVVTAGTIIGSGSAIAASAVVVDDVPEKVLAGGIPAKVIKKLDNLDETT